MAVALAGSTIKTSQTTSTTDTVTFDAAASAGDVLLVFYSNTTTVATPSGWTLEASELGGVGNLWSYVFSKVAAGSETTQDFVLGGTDCQRVAIAARFTGAASSFLREAIVEVTNDTGEHNQSSASSVGSALADDMAVTFVAIKDASTITQTAPSGWTEQQDNVYTFGFGHAGCHTKAITGTESVTATVPFSDFVDAYRQYLLILKPSAAGTTVAATVVATTATVPQPTISAGHATVTPSVVALTTAIPTAAIDTPSIDRTAAIAVGRVFNRSSTGGGGGDPTPGAGRARTRMMVYPAWTGGNIANPAEYDGREYFDDFEDTYLNRDGELYGVVQFSSDPPEFGHAIYAAANPGSGVGFTGAWKRTNGSFTFPLAANPSNTGSGEALTAAGRTQITANLQAALGGQLDEHMIGAAQHILAGGYTTPIIRLGHEANGWWYAWSIYGSATNQALYVQVFQHHVNLIRSVIPGALFDFNSAGIQYDNWDDFEAAYPGDEFVDIVSTDIYNTSYPGARAAGTWVDSQDVWDTYIEPFFDSMETFAFARDASRTAAGLTPLQLAVPEWGPARDSSAGGGDDPLFVTNMFNKLQSWGTRLEYHAPFEGLAHFEVGYFMPPLGVAPHPTLPLTSLKFKELFGNPGQGGGDIPNVNQNATANAVAVLKYLRALRGGSRWLTGQWGVVRQFTTGLTDIATIQATSGETPAVLGIDYQHAGTSGAVLTEPSNTQAIAHWNSNGLIIMNLHAWNPITQVAAQSSGPTLAQVQQMVVDGSSANTALIDNLLAPLRDGLLELQTAGVVVILRLWHEWGFWWSRNWDASMTDAALKALWIYSYEWLESEGVNNTLRMYGPKGDTYKSAAGGFVDGGIHPGYENIDIVGLSVYELPTSAWDHWWYSEIQAADVPMLLGEFGQLAVFDPWTPATNFDGRTLYDAAADEPGWIGTVSWWDDLGITYMAGGGVAYMQDARAINRGDVNWTDYL
jgi:beta-mannanase